MLLEERGSMKSESEAEVELEREIAEGLAVNPDAHFFFVAQHVGSPEAIVIAPTSSWAPHEDSTSTTDVNSELKSQVNSEVKTEAVKNSSAVEITLPPEIAGKVIAAYNCNAVVSPSAASIMTSIFFIKMDQLKMNSSSRSRSASAFFLLVLLQDQVQVHLSYN